MPDYKTYSIVVGNQRKPLIHSDADVPQTGWRGVEPYCVQSSGANTGMRGFHSLQLYDVSSGRSLGVTKPNTSSDPDYIPPTSNTTACPIPGSISVEPPTLNVGWAETEHTFSITANQAWELTNFSPGLSFNKTSGSGSTTISVLVAANQDSFDISKFFTLRTTGGTSTTVTIAQGAYDPDQLEVIPDSLTFEASGGTKAVEVVTSQTWSYTNNTNWASVSRSGGILTITAATQNGLTRYGSIQVNGQTKNATIGLTQQGVQLYQVLIYGTGTELGEYEGADSAWDALDNAVIYDVYSNHQVPQPGTVYYPNSWSGEPLDGQGGWYLHGDYVVQIGQNGWAGAVIPVEDVVEPDPGPDPPSNGIYPPSILFPAEGGIENIQITALNNAAWTASTDGLGVQLNDSIGVINGSGSASISVSVPSNPFDQIVMFVVTVNISGAVYNCHCTQAPAQN